MNYLKIYNQLIEKRINDPAKVNFEKHHIKPKSLYPELKNDKSNLVCLTYKEHYVAHHLLYHYYKSISWKEATYKMACAWFRMCKNKNGIHVSSYMYEKAKIIIKEIRKEFRHTEKSKIKISKALKGRNATWLIGKEPWMKGKHHTEESKEKNKIAHLGKKYSYETNIKKGRKGNLHHNYGKHHSKETRRKISEALKSRKNELFENNK